MNFTKNKIFIAILFMFIGILITIQIKTIKVETSLNNRLRNLNDLKQLLEFEKERVVALEQVLTDYEHKIEEYEKSYLKENKKKILKRQLDWARFVGGLTDVTGPGVIVKLDDSKIRLSEGVNPLDTVIHDYQLIEIINLLKSRGAQAISINDERVVSTTETQCAGPTVSVNEIRYSVPFVIKAIGNSDYLEASLKEPTSIINIMAINGIEISIKKEEELIIPKYKYYYKYSDNVIKNGGVG